MTDAATDTLRALYGTDVPPIAARAFSVGRLSFEMVGGDLRAIRVDGEEVLRGIQYLVRDRDWGTLAPAIRHLEIDERDGDMRIGYVADCVGPDGDRLRYAATIVARETGLDVVVEAEAIDDVTTARLGFCVLHPAGLAGAPLRVEHGDGSVEESRFPDLIEPWQPFTDIAALIHRQRELTIACRLEGDTFEMEDQRNWSDASYKTYVRPLAKPWPYVVPAGTIDRQSVRLELTGALSRPRPAASRTTEITMGAPIGVMPRIGLVVTPAEAEATLARRPTLIDAGVQDLLLSFESQAGQGRAEMAALARAVAGLPHCKTLECVIAADGDLDAELGRIADHVARSDLRLDAVAIYPAPDLQSTPPGSAWPDCPPLADIYAAARRAFRGLALGGGMYSYFTELNRKRPPLDRLDFVSHATCPIVHAADDLSVMQSLEAIPPILRSARAIVGDKPYRLGPVTIGMRQNPYGSRTMPNPRRERMAMAMCDPRQDGRFAAAWTIGYAAATEGAALDTLTLGAVTGPLGVIGENGPRPVYTAVAMLARMAGLERRACRSSAPDKVAAVSAGERVVVANLTARVEAARIGNVELSLKPFEIAEVVAI
ncbi:MAG: hypothetical protein ACTHJR_01160 [Sphingomonas sp.]|uniref:hypothetical protein n=1 Tax=Sphingomonas sp. TaxID=28214 RepID=UPI003F821932